MARACTCGPSAGAEGSTTMTNTIELMGEHNSRTGRRKPPRRQGCQDRQRKTAINSKRGYIVGSPGDSFLAPWRILLLFVTRDAVRGSSVVNLAAFHGELP